MLHLDISSSLAKAITGTYGISNDDLNGLRTSIRRYIEDFLKERQKGQHAWSMDPYDKRSVERVKEIAVRAKAEGITTVVWIGIGGSSLGPQVLAEVFGATSRIKMIVLDTMEPEMIHELIDGVNWKSTLVVVASKSGDTLEPMSLFFLCYDLLKKTMKGKAAQRVVALTDPEKGALRTLCIEEGIQMITIPPAVGGRYSILCAIGLLPLALLDADVDKFIRGAKEMDTLCQTTSLEENPAALLAAMQYLFDTKKHYGVRVIMPYSTRLRSLARWNQQLIAESLGKNEGKNPIPLAAMGTQDQHSLLQQWMEGPRSSWHLFIRVAEHEKLSVPRDVPPGYEHIASKPFGDLLEACYEGTSKGLTAAKRAHVTISLSKLDSYHLGQLFFLLLTEVVLLGKLYRIDPYGQPGVEIGKKITKEILSKP